VVAPYLRYIIGVVGAVFLVLYYAYRWKQASAYSDAMAREVDQTRQWHMQLMNHPAWAHLHRFLASQGIHVVPVGPQPGQYQLRLLTLNDARGQKTAPGDPRGQYLNAYCLGPKKIVGSLTLQTGQPTVRECVWGEWPAEADQIG
jgi:hypothetical protein